MSWLVMILLAKRLPPGLLREAAEFLPACVTTARRLRGNPVVPRRSKIALLIAIVWVLSPIDVLPEFLPVIGPLDDIVGGQARKDCHRDARRSRLTGRANRPPRAE